MTIARPLRIYGNKFRRASRNSENFPLMVVVVKSANDLWRMIVDIVHALDCAYFFNHVVMLDKVKKRHK